MVRSLVASLVVVLASTFNLVGCKEPPPPTITVPSAPPTPVTVTPHLTLPDGGLPTPIVNVAAPTIVIPSTVHCGPAANDCDGDTVLDDMTINGDQCPTVPRGNTPDPSRPGCPLTILPVDASPDVINDASVDVADDAKPDGGMATEDVIPAADAAMAPIPPPDAPVVPALPQPPVPPAPAASLNGTDIAMAIRGGIPVSSDRMEAAQQFCRISAAMVRDAMNRGSNDRCPTGTRVGCWARMSNNPAPNCDNNNRPFGCIQRDGQGQSLGANGCFTSGPNQRDNIWTFECVEGQTCTPQAVASALYPLIVPAQ
jgi:hypothetical protein